MDLVLRQVTEGDLATFFDQQLDPAANHMAAFTRGDPADREAFMAHWARMIGVMAPSPAKELTAAGSPRQGTLDGLRLLVDHREQDSSVAIGWPPPRSVVTANRIVSWVTPRVHQRSSEPASTTAFRASSWLQSERISVPAG